MMHDAFRVALKTKIIYNSFMKPNIQIKKQIFFLLFKNF